MKKIVGVMAAIAITFFIAAQSHAQTAMGLDNAAAGGGINITNLNNSIGVSTFQFSPSPQVWTDGASGGSYFVAGAVHNQAMGTGGGKAYGMAYDSTAVFWMNAEGMTADAKPTTLVGTGSNSTVFSSWKR